MKNSKNKIRFMALLTAMTVAGTVFAIGRQDGAVNTLQEQGILVGDENGDLRLSDNITRAEFSKLVCEVGIGLDGDGQKSEFSDVTENHWAYNYINKMTKAGLIAGYGDGRFGPDDNITLIQAETIALRVVQGYAPEKESECAAQAMELGIIDNVKALHHEIITREDAVNIIYNMMSVAENDNIGYGVASGSSGSGGSSNKAMAMPMTMAMESVACDGAYMLPYNDFNTEEYSSVEETGFKNASISPVSTFSIDTDTASYSNVRRFILSGQVPDKGAVRTEELINYFSYDNEKPKSGEVFGVTTEVGKCPWNEDNLVARISIQGEELPMEERQPQNLVFLIDVSGSMYSKDKLPLVKRSIGLLLDKLDERDRVSIVTYAGGTSVVLEGATGGEREKIENAIDSLRSGGGTYGSAGLILAYEQAEKFKVDGNNRIILCTDGDFNVGVSSESELKSLVEEKREGGIFLSIMGFGTGNLKDNKLEIMADNGNGSYYYIDNLKEAKKVLVDDMTKTLYTIAKDVKLQVEFNPEYVAEYRLIGYENRTLQTEDFENDKKDAGELGAGTTVTALYEIVPKNKDEEVPTLRYQTMETTGSNELMCVNIRYKAPNSNESILREYPVAYGIKEELSEDFNFSASVALFGMILHDSEFANGATYDDVINLADNARGEDKYGYRSEFINLVDILRMV